MPKEALHYFSMARKLTIATSILAILALVALVWWFFCVRGLVYSDDARFDGNLVDIAPQISETLSAVLVHEGDHVKQGDLLLVLDKESRQAALAQAEAALQAAQATVELNEVQVAQAQAALSLARIELKQTQVVAPFDGLVVRRWRDPGSMLLQGTPVLTLFDPASLRIAANIEEQYLHRIMLNAPVDISVDAFPDLHLQGRVDKILHATNSEFSLIPAQGISGTFIKVTQRIALRIAIDDIPKQLPLGPGLSVEVNIHVQP